MEDPCVKPLSNNVTQGSQASSVHEGISLRNSCFAEVSLELLHVILASDVPSLPHSLPERVAATEIRDLCTSLWQSRLDDRRRGLLSHLLTAVSQASGVPFDDGHYHDPVEFLVQLLDSWGLWQPPEFNGNTGCWETNLERFTDSGHVACIFLPFAERSSGPTPLQELLDLCSIDSRASGSLFEHNALQETMCQFVLLIMPRFQWRTEQQSQVESSKRIEVDRECVRLGGINQSPSFAINMIIGHETYGPESSHFYLYRRIKNGAWMRQDSDNPRQDFPSWDQLNHDQIARECYIILLEKCDR